MPKPEIQIKVKFRTPDSRRDERDMSLRVSKPLTEEVLFDASIPRVPYRGPETDSKETEIPAVVELQARYTGSTWVAAGREKVLESHWVAWAGPRDLRILAKLRDVAYLESALGPMCELMTRNGINKGASFSAFFCPYRVGGKKQPYFDCDFHSMDPSKRQKDNDNALNAYLGLPRLWNWALGERFGRLWQPDGYTEDSWHQDELYDQLFTMMYERVGGMVCDVLWSSWIGGNSQMTFPLAKQGIKFGEITPVGLRAPTEASGRPRMRTGQRTVWGQSMDVEELLRQSRH